MMRFVKSSAPGRPFTGVDFVNSCPHRVLLGATLTTFADTPMPAFGPKRTVHGVSTVLGQSCQSEKSCNCPVAALGTRRGAMCTDNSGLLFCERPLGQAVRMSVCVVMSSHRRERVDVVRPLPW